MWHMGSVALRQPCGRILDTGTEPVPPALESRFLATGPREVPVRCFPFLFFFFFQLCWYILWSVEVLCPFLYWVVFLLLVLRVLKKHILDGLFYVNLTEPRHWSWTNALRPAKTTQTAYKTLFLGVAVKVSPKRLVSREDMP